MNSSSPLVIHLVISLAPGGLERLVVDWTNARNRRSPGSTRICCLDEPGLLAEQVQGAPVVCVNAHRARWPFDLAAVRRLRTVFRGLIASSLLKNTDDVADVPPRNAKRLDSPGGEESPASGACAIRSGQSGPVLHAHNLAAWQYAVITKVMGLFLPRRAKGYVSLRLVYTQHGANIHNLNFRDRLRARVLACFTDEIIAVSEATASVMSNNLWIPRRRIRVVMNGVAEGNSRPTREDESVPDKVIGSVGRLAKVKGQDRLIAAVASYQSDNNPFPKLLLVGDGPERGAFERQARESGVAARVVFAGYQADPAPYLARMDLFVLPSRSEGLSIALLEAMAAGVPVAVTDVGANREILQDGRCGVMLPDDEREWGRIFMDILRDQAATAARARAAQDRVRRHYSLSATLDHYEKIYCPGT